METDYKHRTYPIFPLGSFGYVVNRKWAEYVASDENIDNLYEYQGEDTSTGIWMDEAPNEIREKIRYVFTWYFQNNRNCTDPNRAIGWGFWFFFNHVISLFFFYYLDIESLDLRILPILLEPLLVLLTQLITIQIQQLQIPILTE